MPGSGGEAASCFPCAVDLVCGCADMFAIARRSDAIHLRSYKSIDAQQPSIDSQRRKQPSEFGPPPERGGERKFVGGFEAAPCWNTPGDSSECNRVAFEKIDNVIGGGFAFDIGRKREDDFRDCFAIDAIDQFLDPQILRADVIEW